MWQVAHFSAKISRPSFWTDVSFVPPGPAEAWPPERTISGTATPKSDDQPGDGELGRVQGPLASDFERVAHASRPAAHRDADDAEAEEEEEAEEERSSHAARNLLHGVGR